MLIASKLDIPVLAIAGEKGIGAANAGFARVFADDLQGNVVLAGAGHFVAEERPNEVAAALSAFLA
jgi:pimeloyl-ACP methyl ester carboxylesterase